jgi:hypothetical protein
MNAHDNPRLVERRIGIAGVAGVIAGWVILLYVQTFTSVCAPSVRLFSWLILLISLASPVAVLWAAVKGKWWWAFGLLPAVLLLLSMMGTFEGC